MIREIPEGSVELQTGLYLYEYNLVIGGRTYLMRELYSSEGYCFKDMNDVVEDESQRLYYQYMALAIQQSSWTHEQLNAVYISVPVEEGMQIANITTPNVDI